VDVTLQKSTGGRFEITLDGEQIYSKIESLRFPEPDEVEKLLEEKL
jgi:selT/selW/selH-like putative selenoprotein